MSYSLLKIIPNVIRYKFLLLILCLFPLCQSQAQDYVTSSQRNYDSKGIFETIDAMMEAVRQKDLIKAYDQYTSVDYKSSTPFLDFAKFICSFPPLSDNATLTLGSIAVQERIAVYEGIITSKSEDSLAIIFHLSKEGKKWKILSMTLYTIELKKQPNDTKKNV